MLKRTAVAENEQFYLAESVPQSRATWVVKRLAGRNKEQSLYTATEGTVRK